MVWGFWGGGDDGRGFGGPGEGFFAVPVRPGIAMNLGKNCFRSAFNNFKFHLHGLKRYSKKTFPRPPKAPPVIPAAPKTPYHLLGRKASDINLSGSCKKSTWQALDYVLEKGKKSAIKYTYYFRTPKCIPLLLFFSVEKMRRRR